MSILKTHNCFTTTIEQKKLNLGCGSFKKDGYLNIDINPNLSPDVTHDLNNIPYPFPSDFFDIIEADHVLEHLENPLGIMKEIHRISKKDAKLIIRVPHFSRGFTHPDHKRGFDVSFPYYFNPTFQGGYTGVSFKIESLKLKWFAQPYLKKTVLSQPVYFLAYTMGVILDFAANLSPSICSRLWCFIVGGFEEIEFIFTCKKTKN